MLFTHFCVALATLPAAERKYDRGKTLAAGRHVNTIGILLFTHGAPRQLAEEWWSRDNVLLRATIHARLGHQDM